MDGALFIRCNPECGEYKSIMMPIRGLYNGQIATQEGNRENARWLIDNQGQLVGVLGFVSPVKDRK